MNLQGDDTSELAVHVALGDDKQLIGKGISIYIELCSLCFQIK